MVASSGTGDGGGLVSVLFCVKAITMVKKCCDSSNNRVRVLKNEGEGAMWWRWLFVTI